MHESYRKQIVLRDKTDFVNLDQASGNLMSGSSLSVYLKHSIILGKDFQTTV